jgi:hypothetical protein
MENIFAGTHFVLAASADDRPISTLHTNDGNGSEAVDVANLPEQQQQSDSNLSSHH